MKSNYTNRARITLDLTRDQAENLIGGISEVLLLETWDDDDPKSRAFRRVLGQLYKFKSKKGLE